MPLKAIRIKRNDRVFVAGQSGSGKSVLAQRVLRSFSRLGVLDSKGDLGPWGLEEASTSAWERLAKDQPIRMRITKPAGEPLDFWVNALVRLYEAGNVMIYIDEASHIFRTPNPPDIIWDIWQRGRVFGVGGYAASQRPAFIPQLFLSEANHFFMFRLNTLTDRKKMAELMGPEVIGGIPPGPENKHGFWYRNLDMEKPVYIRRLEMSKGDADDMNLKVEVGNGTTAVREG